MVYAMQSGAESVWTAEEAKRSESRMVREVKDGPTGRHRSSKRESLAF